MFPGAEHIFKFALMEHSKFEPAGGVNTSADLSNQFRSGLLADKLKYFLFKTWPSLGLIHCLRGMWDFGLVTHGRSFFTNAAVLCVLLLLLPELRKKQESKISSYRQEPNPNVQKCEHVMTAVISLCKFNSRWKRDDPSLTRKVGPSSNPSLPFSSRLTPWIKLVFLRTQPTGPSRKCTCRAWCHPSLIHDQAWLLQPSR